MSDPSVVAHQPAQSDDHVVAETPALRPVQAASQDEYGASLTRTLSLGGSLAPKLSTFTIGTRLRGRSLVEDIDLTPDEILEVLITRTGRVGL